MNYANIITNAGPVSAVPGGIYEGIDYHGEPPQDVAMRAGWRFVEPYDVPDGQRVAGWVQADDPDYAEPVFEPIPAVPDPVPERFTAGIDAPLLVLDAPDGERGIGYTPAEDGTLLPLMYAHASPYDMAALQSKIGQARADHSATRQARQVEAADIAAKTNAAGNSMPALRAEVVRLAKLVESMIGGGR